MDYEIEGDITITINFSRKDFWPLVRWLVKLAIYGSGQITHKRPVQKVIDTINDEIARHRLESSRPVDVALH